MDIQTMETMRTYLPGVAVLRSYEDLDAYDDAIEAFARGGSRCKLFELLFALGMTAAEIRWHAVYPGCRMATTAPDGPDLETVPRLPR